MMIHKTSIINVLLIAVLAVVVFSPDARAALIGGLMHAGFYQPDLTPKSNITSDGIGDARFSDNKGRVVRLNDLKGKVVFLNFWAAWCPPCRAEMPSLEKLYKQFSPGDNIVWITVDADSKLEKAEKFLKRKKYSFPVYSVAGELPASLFSGSLPTTVVLDKKGVIVFRHEGAADYSDKGFTGFIKGLTQQ